MRNQFRVHPYHLSWQKRVTDIFLSTILSIVLSPLMVSIAFIIYATSGWPVIFTQLRTGQHKKPFTLYKFRTMYRNAHKHQKKYAQLNQVPAPMFKITSDPRFVGIGKWLSRTGLDELPQLFNILKGEMSFVGPRPLPISEATQLDSSWDFRYLVRPGIFSAWSVKMKSHTSLNNWKALEKSTVKNGGTGISLTLTTETLLTILFYTMTDIFHLIVSKFRVQR
jgi:lipopolysaccharide/colanic/teichoic acid biosynthesis glycosyltransferase